MKRIINIDRSVCSEVRKNQSNKPINKLFVSETPKSKIITIYLLKMPGMAVQWLRPVILVLKGLNQGHCSKLMAVLGYILFQVSLA